MSKLLEPIAVSRPKDDYLSQVNREDWVTVDPNGGRTDHDQLKYTLNESYRAPEPKPISNTNSSLGMLQEEMPADYERENLDIIEILRRHNNRSTGQSSGPCLRSLQLSNGEIAETFPLEKSVE